MAGKSDRPLFKGSLRRPTSPPKPESQLQPLETREALSMRRTKPSASGKLPTTALHSYIQDDVKGPSREVFLESYAETFPRTLDTGGKS